MSYSLVINIAGWMICLYKTRPLLSKPEVLGVLIG